MKKYTTYLKLSILGPFITAATSVESYGLDKAFHYGGLVKLSGPVDVIVRMLADAASPVALFTIGAVLWRAGQHAHTRTPVQDFLPAALIKLFVHPLLVFALAASALALARQGRIGGHLRLPMTELAPAFHEPLTDALRSLDLL
mgnify:CR=1 FL=1